MKIDTTKIEGFDGMSPEEKVEAFLNYDFGSEDDTIEKRYKNLISKANAEAKQYKDKMREAEEKLKSHMSEEEKARAEEAEQIQAIREENERLKRESVIAKKAAFYKSVGYSDELAQETAEAFASGDFDTVEKNQLLAHENYAKELKAETTRNNPYPQNAGASSKKMTKKEIMAVKDRVTRQKLIEENIELFT